MASDEWCETHKYFGGPCAFCRIADLEAKLARLNVEPVKSLTMAAATIKDLEAKLAEQERYWAFFSGCAGFPYKAKTPEDLEHYERGEKLKARIEELAKKLAEAEADRAMLIGAFGDWLHEHAQKTQALANALRVIRGKAIDAAREESESE